MYDATRREYVLDRAINDGRIAASGRPDWVARYDHDPAGTEATLAVLAPTPGAGVLGHGDPVEQTLAAGRALLGLRPVAKSSLTASRGHSRYVPVASDADLAPTQVEAWTRAWFPEARASGKKSRIASDGQYTRDAAA